MAKNITLSVDEDVLTRVRTVARERGTSVNGLVRAHLEALAKMEHEREHERRRLLADLKVMSRRSGARLPEGYRFDREDAYEGRLG